MAPASDTKATQEHAEIIYENGDFSVAALGNLSREDFLESVQLQHQRAKNALPIHDSWGEAERPVVAVRVKKVLFYDEHPHSLSSPQHLSADVAKKELLAALQRVTNGDGVVSVAELSAEVAQMTNPLVESAPHESNYKANETDVVDFSER